MRWARSEARFVGWGTLDLNNQRTAFAAPPYTDALAELNAALPLRFTLMTSCPLRTCWSLLTPQASLDAIASQTRVLLSTAGPFAL